MSDSDTDTVEPAHRGGHRRNAVIVVAVLVLAAMLQLLGANPATSAAATVVAHKVGKGPGLDPGAGVWDRVSPVDIPLTAQQTTYPMGGGSVKTVGVQAIHDAGALYLRVSWDDSVRNDTTRSVQEFSDAGAIEFPATAGAAVPSICMGQAEGGVNIWQWRADSQKGIPASSSDLGNGAADIDASNDPLNFPARNAGNPYAQVGKGPVQNLTAVGFGTISPLAEQAVEGRGEWSDGQWAVVYKRALTSPGEGQPSFEGLDKTDVAFAAWDGANQERNGKKSVSQFVTLKLSKSGVPGKSLTALWIAIGAVLIVGAGVMMLGSAFRKRKDA